MKRMVIEEAYMKSIGMIDTHAHRIHPDRAPDLSQVNCYAPGKGQEIHTRQTILYRTMIERLRVYLQMPQTSTVEEVEAERERRYRKEPKGFFADMVRDSHVDMYCMEIGSPLFGKSYSPEEIAYFNESIPERKQCNIVRIERLVDDLLPKKLPFSEFLKEFDREFDRQTSDKRTVGIKSCAAYYGGLDVEERTEKEAAQAYEKMRNGQAGIQEQKALYQYFLWHGTDFAAKYDLPIQIHTGQGAGDYIDYRSMNPICLTKFLMDSRVRDRIRIILLHGGHPYEEDTGNLVLQFANVYTDFSGVVWFGTVNGASRLRALCERAPLDKIMYGSDATMLPELYWYSPEHFRRLLGEVLTDFVQEGYMTIERAAEVTKMILRENALNCYDKIRKLL